MVKLRRIKCWVLNHNPFRKIRIEQYNGEGKLLKAYRTFWLREHWLELFLKINPSTYLLIGLIILYFKLQEKNWKEELKKW